jgi:hypothetical protein
MNDEPKLLLINHTIVNTRHVTHMTYQEADPTEVVVYFVGGSNQTYQGDIAKALWKRMQSDLDLETVD